MKLAFRLYTKNKPRVDGHVGCQIDRQRELENNYDRAKNLCQKYTFRQFVYVYEI